MTGLLVSLYRWCWTRPAFYKFNRLLYILSLHGMGVLNFETNRLSGEDWFLRRLTKHLPRLIALDVGANEGIYANTLKMLAPDATVFAFEPHPLTFSRLQISAAQHAYTAINQACSDTAGPLRLYDHAESKTGSQHASAYCDVIEGFHGSTAHAWDVVATTVDDFVAEHALRTIHLLKIDVEGHELNVLRGAQQSLARGIIDVIQFEFNALNVISRVFFRDFCECLPYYKFYRMLPTGIIPLGPYNSLFYEIFAFQNIVAIRRDCNVLREYK